VKRAAVGGDELLCPRCRALPAPEWRLYNDWAELASLEHVAGPDPLIPRLYGSDRNVGLIVPEDLGSDTTLDHVLLGGDAQATEQGLVDLVALLGRMHAVTVRRQAEFDQF
jgi:hypothetical protein